MPTRRPLRVALLILTLAALSGCADSRTPAPSLAGFQTPPGMAPARYLAGTLHFDAPANWSAQTGSAPLVVTFVSGPAVIAIWRYPRSSTQPLPHDAATLARARRALIEAAGARDPAFHVLASAVFGGPGVHIVELDALEKISGHVRRVRSAHFFLDGAEVVIDEYAPVSLFHAVDRAVFSPLLHSTRLVSAGGA